MDARTYDLDFVEWTLQQAAALRARPLDVNALDTERLAEEIEDMGREHIRKVSSFLMQMLVHLLKLHLDASSRSTRRWLDEVLRFQTDAVLALTPGIKQRLDADKIWRLAIKRATAKLSEHSVAVPKLPERCPLALDMMLDQNFDPNDALQTLADAMK